MAIINDAAAAPAPQAGMAPQQAQQQQPAPGQEGAQPDQAVQRIVTAATKVIHDPKISPQLLELMRATGDPAKALAQATTLLMRQLFEKSKGSMPPEAALQALPQIIALLGELADAARLFEVNEQVIQQAAELVKADIQGGGSGQQQGGAPAPGAAAGQQAAAQPGMVAQQQMGA